MKRKEKENEKEKKKKKNLTSKEIRYIINTNKYKQIDINSNVKKNKKIQISKTHSMEELSNKSKSTAKIISSIPKKIFNNSMEEKDYLNFSEMDIDFYRINSSLEEDIFNPKYYCRNEKGKKQIVQNRYNMIDTSFDTIKSEYIITDHGDEYIDNNKNNLLKTPSTICNYYEKSEIESDIKNKNKNTNIKKEKKNLEHKKLPKNKSIQIPNNYININLNLNNNIINNNHPIHSNRTKAPKNFSTSNIKITQNNSNTNTNFYKRNGIKSNNTIFDSKKKIKEENSSKVKKRNKDSKKNLYSEIQNNNDIMNNDLKSNIDKYKKKNSIKINKNKKKSFSVKSYSGSDIASNIRLSSNSNYTYNNEATNYFFNKKNIPNLSKLMKKIKDNNQNINLNNNTINNNTICHFNFGNNTDNNLTINNNTFNNTTINNNTNNNIIKINQNFNINNNNESPNEPLITNQNQQKPIMLCLDKTKFMSYFISSTNSNSNKKGKLKNSNNSNYNEKDSDKDKEHLNLNINKKNENYTGRNNPKNINNIRKDIIVKRKNLNKTNNNNYCMNSIGNNIDIKNKTNITFSNFQNGKHIIKVNLKKHIKSSSELMKFINVNSNNKNKNNKNKNSNRILINTCFTKGSVNSSQLVNDLLNRKKQLKSPSQPKNCNVLKISKTLNEYTIINKIKTTPKYTKIHNGENFSSIEKRNYIGSNEKRYYSLKYQFNLKDNGISNLYKNKLIKNSFKPKTQSDIKINKYKIKEDEFSKKSNKENKENNYNDYGMNKRVKQKLLDRMNKVSKNSKGCIWGCQECEKKNIVETFSEIVKSPNKEYFFCNNFYYDKKFISNESSKNDEKDLSKNEKISEKPNQKEINIIKEYKA